MARLQLSENEGYDEKALLPCAIIDQHLLKDLLSIS
jgi:hypothetical protein